jgi:hypothetical protein
MQHSQQNNNFGLAKSKRKQFHKVSFKFKCCFGCRNKQIQSCRCTCVCVLLPFHYLLLSSTRSLHLLHFSVLDLEGATSLDLDLTTSGFAEDSWAPIDYYSPKKITLLKWNSMNFGIFSIGISDISSPLFWM